MDIDIEKKVQEAIEQLHKLAVEEIDFTLMDPIAKLMLVALVNERQKIEDEVGGMAKRITDRYASDFIPHEKIEAVPAIALINPVFRKNTGILRVGSGATFVYRVGNSSKSWLNYIPVVGTMLVPFADKFLLTPHRMSYGKGSREVHIDRTNSLWLGIVTDSEIESLNGLSLLISGTNGILPEHVYVGAEHRELEFSTMREMEKLEMLEPFDAQQSSGQFFSFVNVWKESLLNMEDAALVYVTDGVKDRDVFKPRAYPKIFQQWLEDEALDCFAANTLWLQFDFPDGYEVPDTCEVIFNVLPVANVDVNSLTLTQSAPIAKLQKHEDSFFLRVLETSSASHKQGFDMKSEEIIIRDFDASCYNNGSLYRDVRNLYNRFADDYYAFVEYNGIKDSEVLKQLRETINKLGKSVGQVNAKYKFDSGTYVMRNMNQRSPSTSIKVSYITTQGKIGNSPAIGEFMENKKLPPIESKVTVVASAMGGADKATADERYEQLRYYSLTNDRLYTRMDVEAFLRKEIMATFGKDEFKRIFIRISVQGTGGAQFLQRGLYIDLEFKDKKNYEKAVLLSFDKLMRQKIEGRSCIAMPIIVELHNLEI